MTIGLMPKIVGISPIMSRKTFNRFAVKHMHCVICDREVFINKNLQHQLKR